MPCRQRARKQTELLQCGSRLGRQSRSAGSDIWHFLWRVLARNGRGGQLSKQVRTCHGRCASLVANSGLCAVQQLARKFEHPVGHGERCGGYRSGGRNTKAVTITADAHCSRPAALNSAGTPLTRSGLTAIGLSSPVGMRVDRSDGRAKPVGRGYAARQGYRRPKRPEGSDRGRQYAMCLVGGGGSRRQTPPPGNATAPTLFTSPTGAGQRPGSPAHWCAETSSC